MHEEIILKIKELLSGYSVKECFEILNLLRIEVKNNAKFNHE